MACIFKRDKSNCYYSYYYGQINSMTMYNYELFCCIKRDLISVSCHLQRQRTGCMGHGSSVARLGTEPCLDPLGGS